MRTLFLDLASHQGAMAAVDGSAVVATQAVDHRVSDAELVPLFDAVLKAAKWSPNDLKRVACVTGPGGFTSLRVAVSFANALAYALSIPVAGVHLVDLYTARCPDRDAVWVHSTKKQEVFIRSLTNECITWSWPEPTHTTLQEAIEGTPKAIRYCGELLPEHERQFQEAGFQPTALRPLADVLPALLASLSYNKETLLPWYGRGW